MNHVILAISHVTLFRLHSDRQAALEVSCCGCLKPQAWLYSVLKAGTVSVRQFVAGA